MPPDGLIDIDLTLLYPCVQRDVPIELHLYKIHLYGMYLINNKNGRRRQ